jgi:hypothetical protein
VLLLLSVTCAECCYTEGHLCRGASKPNLLSVGMLNVVRVDVIMLSVICLFGKFINSIFEFQTLETFSNAKQSEYV